MTFPTLVRTETPFAVIIVTLGGRAPHLAITAPRWGTGLIGVTQESEGEDAGASLCISSNSGHGYGGETKVNWRSKTCSKLSQLICQNISSKQFVLWKSTDGIENSIMKALAQHTWHQYLINWAQNQQAPAQIDFLSKRDRFQSGKTGWVQLFSTR